MDICGLCILHLIDPAATISCMAIINVFGQNERMLSSLVLAKIVKRANFFWPEMLSTAKKPTADDQAEFRH